MLLKLTIVVCLLAAGADRGQCKCEQGEEFQERDSLKCSNRGTFECGACTCNEGQYGKRCECDGSTLSSDDYTAPCRMSNTSNLICSGHGSCLCGVCDCDHISLGSPKYSGRFCQCDDYSCDYYEGKLCGGADRGQCKCGKCLCEPGFQGSVCNCPISDMGCRAHGGKGEICNGKGICECGQCRCTADTYYRGKTCEDCPTCPGKCEQNKDCVRCKVHASGPMSEEDCFAKCTHVEVVDELKESSDRKLCRFLDDDGTIFYFTYEYNSNRVQAQITKEAAICPSDLLDRVLACVSDIRSELRGSTNDIAAICGALKSYLCCITSAVRTCDENKRQANRDSHKRLMNSMPSSVSKQLNQCKLDLPNAMDQAERSCVGNTWTDTNVNGHGNAPMTYISVFPFLGIMVLRIFI